MHIHKVDNSFDDGFPYVKFYVVFHVFSFDDNYFVIITI